MGILRTLVKNPVKKSLYRKRKKKVIYVLIAFFVFHKSDVNIFFN